MDFSPTAARQAGRRVFSSFSRSGAVKLLHRPSYTVIPVSYTHLDVYKRQVLAASGTVNSGGDPLRVRADPNTSSQILTKLSDGTQVEVLEQAENGWYKIAHEGISGFVSGEYLVVHEEGQEQAVALAAEADAEAASTFGRITASSLNVRSGPSTDHEKVGSLAAGRVVELLEESDGWYRIENGYISTEYVTIVDPSQISKGQEIADYALQFVGYPYVYGGSSPKGCLLYTSRCV